MPPFRLRGCKRLYFSELSCRTVRYVHFLNKSSEKHKSSVVGNQITEESLRCCLTASRRVFDERFRPNVGPSTARIPSLFDCPSRAPVTTRQGKSAGIGWTD
jgi:hypothetical protein